MGKGKGSGGGGGGGAGGKGAAKDDVSANGSGAVGQWF